MLMWGPSKVTPVQLWSFKQFNKINKKKKSIIISEIRNNMTNFLKNSRCPSMQKKISWELLLGVQFEALNTTMAIFWQNSKVWIAKSILLQGVLIQIALLELMIKAPITCFFSWFNKYQLHIPKTYDALQKNSINLFFSAH